MTSPTVSRRRGKIDPHHGEDLPCSTNKDDDDLRQRSAAALERLSELEEKKHTQHCCYFSLEGDYAEVALWKLGDLVSERDASRELQRRRHRRSLVLGVVLALALGACLVVGMSGSHPVLHYWCVGLLWAFGSGFCWRALQTRENEAGRVVEELCEIASSDTRAPLVDYETV